MGEATPSSTARFTRNRWPSEDTAYCCLLMPGSGPPAMRTGNRAARGSVFQRLAIAFLKRSLQERERLFVAGNRENPQVKARLRIVAAEQQKPSIEGPTGCRFAL